jgi:hypothetical protein
MNKLLIVGTVASTQLKTLWKTDKILGGAGTYIVCRFLLTTICNRISSW